MSDKKSFIYKLDKSAILTALGILALFGGAVTSTVIAPQMAEKSWIEPSSPYQRQMYEIADAQLYISNQGTVDASDLQLVYHLRQDHTLLAFEDSKTLRVVAPPELEKFITRDGDANLKLTSDLLMLREPTPPEGNKTFDAVAAAKQLQQSLRTSEADGIRFDYDILELYRPEAKEAFSIARTDGVIEDWVDENYTILDPEQRQPYHGDPGVVFVSNPVEYKVRTTTFGSSEEWRYDPDGLPIGSLSELTGDKYGFLSRKTLIELGEDIYRIEGCWYCHTDQTRTLIQDVVLNGSESEPAPPSTANEYVYNRVSFPSTRRIGPDMSRVGVKRPSRDWHKAHFWAPKTESPGSIMPRFQHFFDDDPRGTSRSPFGVPNYKFEAIYQYLMTKGTRITAPTQAWWLGRDPVDTKAIIEGRLDPTQIPQKG
ncbi:hypothetical protein SCG7086_AG_00040 [Chlamydiales bacterium SCGC AG-110-P3]|nr:hypothetical protein SCG7086_AG_00040 [Chlamydiales bacterium SCGC AG-110-P3]